jgi:hypothetical protein
MSKHLVRFVHELPMNYNDDRAEIEFARGFLEGVPYQWIRPTKKNALTDSRSSEGASTFVNKSG